MNTDRYRFNLGLIGFFFIFKTYLMVTMFAAYYMNNNGHSIYIPDILNSLAFGSMMFLWIGIWMLGDLVFDIVRWIWRKHKEVKFFQNASRRSEGDNER